MRNSHSLIAALFIFVLCSCDTVQPVQEGTLVIEAYFDAGRPLPAVRVGRTQSLSTPLSETGASVSDATVLLILSGVTIEYIPVPDSAGTYRPLPTAPLSRVPALATFILSVETDQELATVAGMIPPRIRIENVSLSIPDEAIEAILVNTLDLGLDSLDLGLNAQQGFIYPIQVTVDWTSPDAPINTPTDYWIQTRLDPLERFSSSLIDFFLLPEQILPESSFEIDLLGRRRWTGVYAIPVDDRNTPVPTHELKISILRSDQLFARFATSRTDPGQREPITNVVGGLGFVGGVSIDSVRVHIE